MVALTILIVSCCALLASVVSSMQLTRANEEKARASKAATAMIERMHTTPFNQIFASFNQDPADDPLGANLAPGRDFDIPGLGPQAGDADGLAGQVQFPVTIDGAGVLSLREDMAAPEFGMPRDLNGDGAIDGSNHSDDYLLLPVSVSVSWRGAGGDQTITHTALLVE
ncbi:MAG: hypothetical protein L3K26_12445 [Candidatus Hydrogenedentes bacterium]|nr:hypothetical protein [Candidatus Hydrogenedentota bacterium]